MFSKTFFVSALVVFLSTQANAHAIVNPPIGVAGKSARGDVQRPKAGKECGNANIAAGIDAANAVPVDATGNFNVVAQNFNGGRDGSRQFTVQVDASGTGKSFVAGTVSKNGDLAPTAVGTQDITAALPTGTKCVGGKDKNRCLVSFKSAGGFGNCVVVSQGAAAAAPAAGNAAAAPAAGNAAAAPAAGAAAAGTAAAGTAAAVPAKNDAAAPAANNAAGGKKNNVAAAAAPAENAAAPAKNAAAAAGGKKNNAAAAAGGKKGNAAAANGKKGQGKASKNVAGTRAPRALLAELGSEAAVVKRGVLGWFWA